MAPTQRATKIERSMDVHDRALRRFDSPHASGRAIIRQMLVLIRNFSVPQMP
jgi:hypothetical protein